MNKHWNSYGSQERKTLIGFLYATGGWLTPREDQVLRLRYGPDGGVLNTLEDVRRLGVTRLHGDLNIPVSRERIAQIERKAFLKLRRQMSDLK